MLKSVVTCKHCGYNANVRMTCFMGQHL